MGLILKSISLTIITGWLIGLGVTLLNDSEYVLGYPIYFSGIILLGYFIYNYFRIKTNNIE